MSLQLGAAGISRGASVAGARKDWNDETVKQLIFPILTEQLQNPEADVTTDLLV